MQVSLNQTNILMINMIIDQQERKHEIRQTLFEDKVKRSSLGEVAYKEAHVETQFLEGSITHIELELQDLYKDQSTISEQLVEMRKGGGMSMWPKPILHPNKLVNDATCMIIIKACGLICRQW